MRKNTISWRFLTAGSLVLLCLLLIVMAFDCKEKTEEQARQFVFNLKEISSFKVPERNYMNFARGIYAWPKDEPFEQVKRYPELRTDKPLYGELPVYSDLRNVVKTVLGD